VKSYILYISLYPGGSKKEKKRNMISFSGTKVQIFEIYIGVRMTTLSFSKATLNVLQVLIKELGMVSAGL